MINDYSDRFRRLDEIMAKYDEAMHLNEVLFGNQENLKRHYEKHITDAAIDGEIQMKYMSIDDFNELADIISSAPAGSIIKSSKPSENKRVIGYVTKSGNFVKYDTVSGLKVIYRPANQGGAISLYSWYTSTFLWRKFKITIFFLKLRIALPA